MQAKRRQLCSACDGYNSKCSGLHVAISINDLAMLANHSLQLVINGSHLELHRNFFSQRVTHYWNKTTGRRGQHQNWTLLWID